ncbi:MAG: AbrB/MazE/SpoVT family DNA-binding domain-containing protein [Myxococcales bacterium FL481]|nr:MAG: AbrB/MazE/SpoVT family DNA-binding domain-containing protein [Myxococcales bacterium FL481]
MSTQQATRVGKRGTVTIPKSVRDSIGIEEGSILVFEIRDEGVLVRPAITTPVKPEVYTSMRLAEFRLNNSVDEEDYQEARREVEKMGFDPDTVPHDKP